MRGVARRSPQLIAVASLKRPIFEERRRGAERSPQLIAVASLKQEQLGGRLLRVEDLHS